MTSGGEACGAVIWSGAAYTPCRHRRSDCKRHAGKPRIRMSQEGDEIRVWCDTHRTFGGQGDRDYARSIYLRHRREKHGGSA